MLERLPTRLPKRLRDREVYSPVLNEHPYADEFVLDPADNSRLANLCGQFDEHLRQIESAAGVEINHRGSAFRVIGDEAAVQAAREVLRTMYAETRAAVLTPARVHLLLQGAQVTPRRGRAGRAPETDDRAASRHGVPSIQRSGPQSAALSAEHPQLRYQFRHRSGRHRQDLSRRRLRRGGAGPRAACSRIVLVRPAVEAGERLGFLPGDLAQKIDPYLRPMYDALYEMLGFERVARLLERNIIEVAPLAFMRGRSLNDSFIILDEAQNTTVEQMKMFLTRIGFGSSAVVTGDITQIDLPRDRPVRPAPRHARCCEGVAGHQLHLLQTRRRGAPSAGAAHRRRPTRPATSDRAQAAAVSRGSRVDSRLRSDGHAPGAGSAICHGRGSGLPASDMLRRWAEAVLAVTRPGLARTAELSVRIVEADEGARLNREYRHKEGATNVLSFPVRAMAGAALPADILGDIVICAAGGGARGRGAGQVAGGALGAPGGARTAAPARP